MPHPRSTWSSQFAFVIAASASAIGLGNIWRFPYLAAKYGGGVFLLVYLVLVVTLGFSLMVGEVALGRKTRQSPVTAYSALDRRFGFVGWLSSLIPLVILPYYCVIGGWVAKYAAVYFASMLRGATAISDAPAFFSSFITATRGPLLYSLFFILCTFVVVVLGVKRGIENSNKVMMPLLFIISAAIAVYSSTRPGALAGLRYYFHPDFSKFSPAANPHAFGDICKTVLGAMGQMFYSLSLAMGIMITYGSYMPREAGIEKSVRTIEIFDTIVAVVAGLMIIPAVFVYAGADKINAGPGLMFITLPTVFNAIGAAGPVGFAFFVLVFFAALTSAISLMEACVASACDLFRIRRLPSALLILAASLLLAVPSALGYGAWSKIGIGGMKALDLFDFVANNVMMPVAALLTCVFIACAIGVKTITDEVESGGRVFHAKRLFAVMTRYIAPVLIVLILVSSVLNGLGFIKI